MDTLSFFKSVLPERGFRVLAEFKPGQKHPYHRFFASHEELAEQALLLDSQGKTVYHACATYKTDENRKQENAGWMRSFWVDADVEPGNPNKYGSAKEAVEDVGRACKALALPLPLLVRSGRGIHAYWTLDSDVPADEWLASAYTLKSALEHLGFRQDRTRTADSSSVLRPVGTHWRKDGIRPVFAISQGRPISHEAFASRVGDYVNRHLGQQRSVGALSQVDDDDLGGPVDYPPSSADRIIQFCPTLEYVAQRGGDVEEPLWRGMIGVVKYTVEGEARCHEWSKGYDKYDAAETQEKIDRWQKGPTTCDYFRGTNENKCNGCPRNVTSPIQLGYSEESEAPIAPLAGDDEPQKIPNWPKHFRWDGRFMSRALPDSEGAIQWIPFCETLFYPVKRIRQEDRTWALLCRYVKKDPDKTQGEFVVPMSHFGKLAELHALLASHELFPIGLHGMKHMQAFFQDYTMQLQGLGIAQETYDKCGWADKYKSFIIGNKRVTANGEDEILPGERIVNAKWGQGFGYSGTAERWTELVNDVYNREGAEAYQFVIGGAFASPLIELVGVDNWHGIPIGLSGTTGLGKTTVCRVACSMYGNGEMFVLSAIKSQSTMNAIYNRVGVLRNLPVVIDEATKREQDDWIELLYGLSTGRPKDRSTTTGLLVDHGLNWNMVSFVTANVCMTDQLIGSEAAVREATEVRLFEIQLTEEVRKLWPDVNFKIFEQLTSEQYGLVGRIWLRYVIENIEKIKKELHKYRAMMSATDAEGTKERFFVDLIVCVVVALRHAKKLGLVDFDPVKVARWATRHLEVMRVKRSEFRPSADDQIAGFLASLYGRIIVTKHFRDGRQLPETPLEQLRGAPVARMALDDQVFLVSTIAIDEWCAKNHISPSAFNTELDRRGFITRSNLGSDLTRRGAFKIRLTRGTNLPSAPGYVIELNYAKVLGLIGEEINNPQEVAA